MHVSSFVRLNWHLQVQCAPGLQFLEWTDEAGSKLFAISRYHIFALGLMCMELIFSPCGPSTACIRTLYCRLSRSTSASGPRINYIVRSTEYGVVSDDLGSRHPIQHHIQSPPAYRLKDATLHST